MLMAKTFFGSLQKSCISFFNQKIEKSYRDGITKLSKKWPKVLEKSDKCLDE